MSLDSPAPHVVDADALLEAAPTALLHVDRDGRLGLLNAAARQLLGASVQPGQLLRELWADGLDTGCLTGDEPVGLDLPLRGAPRTWVRAQASPLHGAGWVVALQPVGDRHVVERAALAARSVGLGTWEVDLQTGRAVWDEQMWRLRGREPQPEPIMPGWGLTVVHPDDQEHLARLMRDWGSVKTPVDYEFRVLWPDGQVRWLASRSLERRDPVTGASSRLGVNWDVTDLRVAEAARRDSEIARAESQAKSRFLSRMSHELRTPLNAVLGFSQLLLADDPAGGPTSEERRQRLEHIHRAGRHLLDLINDVLELSRLQGGEMAVELQPVALRPLLEETLPLVAASDPQPRVDVRLGALEHAVRADAGRLRQVFLNLLTNAVKYNQDGGSVVIESALRGQEVSISVADTGLGMSDEQRQHLFEPFNRLGREAGRADGTGIGLVITKALVEMMGGRIEVSSVPGHGSRFEVWLAVAAAGAAHPAPAHRPAAGPPADPAAVAPVPRRLLYIEDNPVNALLVADLLRSRPHLSLVVSPDGHSGVARAREWRPDLILLDMQLPDFDGVEVLRRLRAQVETASIPCMVLSASAMPEDIQRARAAGVVDYWTKPLDMAAFSAALDAVLGRLPVR